MEQTIKFSNLSVFPAEMYKDDQYRVVHSIEEANSFARFGWEDLMPVDRERGSYKVHHAAMEPAADRPKTHVQRGRHSVVEE